MERPALEVADIFRDFGPAWREANRGHLSHAQLKVISAIEACRTAALGGYVARCENAECGHPVIAYCSCRNRHCPKCQGSQALAWMEERKAELLQVPYFHVVFTLSAEIGAIGYQNKAEIYGQGLPHLCEAASFSSISGRKSLESTSTGRKKFGLAAIQCLPSEDRPPPGTIMCTCG